MKDRIVLLGGPATGKGTQAALLSAAFGIPAISTGSIFRQELRSDNQLKSEIDGMLGRGELFPDELVLKVVWSWLGDKRRFIFDGFPRTLGQAKAFDEGLVERSIPLQVVYFFYLPEAEIRRRVIHRLTCSDCGATFHRIFSKLATGQACPICGGRLERRSDDCPEALNLRLEQFRKFTLPVVSHYCERGILKKINAGAGRDDVFREIYRDVEGGF